MPLRQLKISRRIPIRESYSLERYLQEIAREELLSPEEEVELARRIRMGDPEALERLVRANLRFVVSVAKQYVGNGLPLEDLISEGNIGLVKAALRFDETRGFKFISYAVWWIRQQIMQAISEHSRMIRMPLNKISVLHKINTVYAQLEQELERDPTPEEIARMAQLDAEEVEQTLTLSKKHPSLDAEVHEGEDTPLKDVVADEEEAFQHQRKITMDSLRKELFHLLARLDPREREIIVLHYGLNGESALPLEEIGERMGMTRERVRQIKERALEKLRRLPEVHRLRQYF